MSTQFRYNTPEWKKLSAAVIRRDKGICTYCGTDIGTMTADHIIPRSKGGADTLDNLVCACISCNSDKSDKTEWRTTWINRDWL